MITDKNNIRHYHQTAIRPSHSKNLRSRLLTKALNSNFPSINKFKDSLNHSIEAFLLRTEKYLKEENNRIQSNNLGNQKNNKKSIAKYGNFSKQGSQVLKKKQNYFNSERNNKVVVQKNCTFIK